MSAESEATENGPSSNPPLNEDILDETDVDATESQEGEEYEDEDDDDDDEPKLKYAKLTGSVTNVYRNGDSTSAFLVAGDKMVLGTHNGSVHVLSLPTLQTIRPYRAHQATVTCVSVSPIPPPPVAAGARSEGKEPQASSPPTSAKNATSASPSAHNSQRTQSVVPNVPRNRIYIATSSLDGHVCISSLIDPKDVQLRNFARPVNAVALSPDYKNDQTYLSGGLAGQLILTEGGKAGVTVDANTNSAAAAASGWLGTLGFGGDRGKDTALHSGEGAISDIRWSLSGKWVVWVNEEGIKIMRSHLKLGSENSEDAWRRIVHVPKPNLRFWEGMAGVWKGRCEWIDDRKLEPDIDLDTTGQIQVNGVNGTTARGKDKLTKGKAVEKLVVGWGDTAWILHVEEGGTSPAGEKVPGTAHLMHKIFFQDCIISGISLYSPSLVAILAWRTRDDDDKPVEPKASSSSPKKGRSHRHTGLPPQLRLVHLATGSEEEVDELPISRSEMLSSQDYHLRTLYIPPLVITKDKLSMNQKGALEGLFDAAGGRYAARMFSSNASVMSGSSGGRDDLIEQQRLASIASPQPSITGMDSTQTTLPRTRIVPSESHPYASCAGLKLFIQSPYDCLLAVRTDLADHMAWLLERNEYADAWKLADKHPEIVDVSGADQYSHTSTPSSPSRGPGARGSLADFLTDDRSVPGASETEAHYSAIRKEKLRIGELWLQQLVSNDKWAEAGQVVAKVLGTSSRWEHWVLTFARAHHFDEITPYIPSTQEQQLPSLVYEVVLGFYIKNDPTRLQKLLDEWDPELFDLTSVVAAIESRLDHGEVTAKTVEDGVRGRDWKILTETLARFYLADGQVQDALKCYIRAQNAEEALRLLKDEKMIDDIADDIPSLLMLKIDSEMMDNASLSELQDACSEVLQILVSEAQRGTLSVGTVVHQLERGGDRFRPFLYFYLHALWHGSSEETAGRRTKFQFQRTENQALVDQYADLAVELFAEYDRILLKKYLETSSEYSFDKAIAICKNRGYTSELVHLLAKTGQTKPALSLIINELDDVAMAVDFAKKNPDLWEDLVTYSMKKPRFIRGLLEEGGTAVDPIELIKRIPENLEIEGLHESISKMMRDYDIQHSIAEGAAQVLRSEVINSMNILRTGQKKGVRFDIVHDEEKSVTVTVGELPPEEDDDATVAPATTSQSKTDKSKPAQGKPILPGHCACCGEVFHEQETEPLLGFGCGHISHLSCLLRASNHIGEAEIQRLERQLGYNNNTNSSGPSDLEAPPAPSEQPNEGDEESGNEPGFAGRSVGRKVAHAHIIRRVVQGGCPVCQEDRG